MSQIDKSSDIYDAIIIGAGAAGIGAARTLVRGGARVLVLEARDRVGGRAACDNTTFPIPVDLGGQWFHQGPANSLLAIAQQEGYAVVHDNAPRIIYDKNKPLDATDPRVLEFGVVAAGMIDTIHTAGGAVAGGSIPDHPASDVIGDFKISDYFKMASTIANPFSHTMDELSVLDFTNFYDKSLLPVGSGLGDEFLIPTGMGNFITDLADGMPVMLSTPVKEILWNQPWGVQITTMSDAVLRAKTVIVTASMGVLAHGDLKFSPALDPAYSKAFHELKMETLCKVFLQFKPEVKLNLPNINCMSLQLTTNSEVPFINAPLWGENIAMMLLTGKLAETVESKSEDEIIDYTIETMRSIFGDQIKRENVLAKSHHSWFKDKWSRGCTSYASPGGVAHRQTLGRPIKNQVFFAGEAVSLYAHSSLHGAYETGAGAARQILKLLRH